MGKSQTFDVTNCDGNHCLNQAIVYEPDLHQIIALMESSSSCSQSIDFQCFSAPLKVSFLKVNIFPLLLTFSTSMALKQLYLFFNWNISFFFSVPRQGLFQMGRSPRNRTSFDTNKLIMRLEKSCLGVQPRRSQ